MLNICIRFTNNHHLQVIPAIKEKWPPFLPKNIIIQQDNARPHIMGDDPDFILAATSDGFNITLSQEPPNSPDMNINDLGFFRAIQSLQSEKRCANVDELVNAVTNNYNELTPHTLNKVFLSLQACMIEVLKVKGGINYKLPHLNKEKLHREGILPHNLTVPMELVHECVDYLIARGAAGGMETLFTEMGME